MSEFLGFDISMPDEFLLLACLVVLADRALVQNPFLDVLLEFPPLSVHQASEQLVLGKDTSTLVRVPRLREYVQRTSAKLQLRSLPFLTEEVQQELLELQVWSDSHGETIFNELCRQASVPNHLMTSALRETVDFHFILFLEWMNDIQFIAATSAERRRFLREFPFEELREEKR